MFFCFGTWHTWRVMVSLLQLVASILLLCHFGSPAVEILFFFLCVSSGFFFQPDISGVLGFYFLSCFRRERSSSFPSSSGSIEVFSCLL